MLHSLVRRALLAAGVIAMLAPAAHAQAPIVIKFSHVVTPDTPKGKAALKFKQLAEAAIDRAVGDDRERERDAVVAQDDLLEAAAGERKACDVLDRDRVARQPRGHVLHVGRERALAV